MRIRLLIASGAATLALTIAGCGGGDTKTATFSVEPPPPGSAEATQAEAPAAQDKPKVQVPPGPPPKKLQIKDLKKGTGATAKANSQVEVNYVGVSYSTKKEFDSSFGGQPFSVALGQGAVIPGWDKGIPGMKVGGRRQLIIPPDMAYGATGSPPAIKPNETLVFVVDLISVQ